MAKLTPEQRKQVFESLALEKNRNYTNLELYLRQLLSGRDVTFLVGNQTLTVPVGEAWTLILAWGQSESGNLPLGDRGSMRSRASRLLNYIDSNLIGQSTEAAASYRLILEQAKNPVVKPGEVVTDPTGLGLQKAFDVRRTQIKLLQDGIVGKISTNLEKTKFLKNIQDPRTRALVMQMIAASNINFRSPSDFTPEHINQLLLHEPGYEQLNNAMHLAYSRSTQADFTELHETINNTIAEVYKGDETKYAADMATLRDLANLSPDLGDVNWMVDHIASASFAGEKARLIGALRSTIIASARTNHQDGKTILTTALAQAGLPDTSLASLESMIPCLEEIEVKQRHSLLGFDLSDRDSRLLATSGLVAHLGVDLTTPWLKKSDLDKVTQQILAKHGVATLAEAYGKTGNPAELSEIKNLIGKTNDYAYYQGSLRGNVWLRVGNFFDHRRGEFSGVTGSVDRLRNKIWAGYDKIYAITNYPQSKLVDGLIAIEEKFPLLNPTRFIAIKWSGFQIGIAGRLNGWAVKASTSSRWFSGFATHLADFTQGFTKTNGSWSGASFFFAQRKFGNALDWSAKVVFHQESFNALRVSVGKAIVSFGMKVAPGLTEKIVTAIGTATSESGIGLAILGAQVLWEVGKSVVGKVANIIKSLFNGDSKNLFGGVPLLLGTAFLAVNAALAGIPAAIMVALEVLKAGLKIVWDGLVSMLLLAGAIGLGAIIIVSLLFNLFKTTVNLDAAPDLAQFVANVVCNNPSSAGGSPAPAAPTSSAPASAPAAQAAACIVSYLNQFHLNPLTPNLLGGSFWKQLAAVLAKAALDALAASAPVDGHLQCVGFVIATAALTYGQGFQPNNACGYIGNPPAGYSYVSGTSGMKEGDFFLMGNSGSGCTASTPGHIGVVCGPAGTLITACDANADNKGTANANSKWPIGDIKGYLRKK